MRLNPLFVFVAAVVIGVAVIHVASQAHERAPESPHGPTVTPGALPTWSVGDNWVYENSTGAIYTYSVTSEGQFDPPWDNTPCYRVTGTIDPLSEWGGNILQWYRKATLDFRKDRVFGGDRDRSSTFTHSYSADPWPLEVGKTYTVTTDESTDRTISGDGYTEGSSHTFQITIETFENVSVRGQKFECFKLVKREGGTLVETRWYSDVVKREVKQINHQTGEVLELVSYRVQ